MPSPLPSCAEPPRGQPVPVGQADVLGVEPLEQRAHPLAVAGIALVVAAVALEHARVRRAYTSSIGRPTGGSPPVMNASRRPCGRDREVRHRRRSPPKLWPSTLQRSTPSSCADELGVAHDRVGAEVRQVVGLLRGRQPGQRADRRRAARAALVEHQHAVVRAAPGQPAGAGRVARRPRRLDARAALEEHEERPVAAVRVGDLAREDGDRSPSGAAWSRGTVNSCSVRTSPRVANVCGTPPRG